MNVNQLAQLAKTDREACGILYGKFERKFHKMSQGDADLFANLSTAFMVAVEKFDPERGGFHTLLHNQCMAETRDHWRLKARQSQTEQDRPATSKPDVDLDLSGISPLQREIAEGLMAGLSQADIARQRGVSRNAISKQVSAMRDLIKR